MFSLFICRTHSQDEPRRINEREESANFIHPRHSDDRYSASRHSPSYRGRGRGHGYEHGNEHWRGLGYEQGNGRCHGHGYEWGNGRGYESQRGCERGHERGRSYARGHGPPDRRLNYLPKNPVDNRSLMNFSGVSDNTSTDAKMKLILEQSRTQEQLYSKLQAAVLTNVSPFGTVNHASASVRPGLLGDHPDSHIVESKRTRSIEGNFSETTIENRKSLKEFTIPRKVSRDSSREQSESKTEDTKTNSNGTMLGKDSQRTDSKASNQHENQQIVQAFTVLASDLQSREKFGSSSRGPEAVIRPLFSDSKRQSTPKLLRPPQPLMTNESNMRFFRQPMPDMPENFMVGNRGLCPSRWLPPGQSNQRGRFPPPRGYLHRPQHSHNMKTVSSFDLKKSIVEVCRDDKHVSNVPR